MYSTAEVMLQQADLLNGLLSHVNRAPHFKMKGRGFLACAEKFAKQQDLQYQIIFLDKYEIERVFRMPEN